MVLSSAKIGGWFREPLRSLETIQVEGDITTSLEALPAACPNLRGLHWRTWRFFDPFDFVIGTSTSILWTTITDIHINVTVGGAAALLELCSSLLSAFLVVPAINDSTVLSQSPTDTIDHEMPSPRSIQAPRLRALTIDTKHKYQCWSKKKPLANMCTLLRAVCAPSLTSLSLLAAAKQSLHLYDAQSSDKSELSDSVLALFETSPMICSFRVEGVPMTDSDLLTVLRKQPHLTNLILGEASLDLDDEESPLENHLVTDNLLNALTLTQAEETGSISSLSLIAPKLRHIEVKAHFDWDFDVMEDMLESRQGTLESAHIRTAYPLQSLDLQHIQALDIAIRIFVGEYKRNSSLGVYDDRHDGAREVLGYNSI
ncbi:hypothetical protein VNI00_016573 [Paramarasmius palmivorus]|uniref:Uncharacterized protein n=1 Tax=Paramarasmius palmivorus TaxID=297713 RepID=A0AAW0BD54_9AGAR